MSGRFIKKIFITGTIETLSGLHISSFNDNYSLGILDKAIIRDSLTNYPFIPGSSIKGKIRVLLERFSEQSDSADSIIDSVRKLFGISSNLASKQPGRAIFRDAVLSEQSAKLNLPFADLPYAEIKKECFVNRETGKATASLIERVPSGHFFDMEIILNIFEDDDEDKLIQTLLTGFSLLQDDYLGARGTRGYGCVKIHIQSISAKEKSAYLTGQAEPSEYQINIPDNLK